MAPKIFRVALLTVTSAVTLPAGQPDGVYMVSIDSHGQETHTLLLATDSISNPPLNLTGHTINERVGVDWPPGTQIVCENQYLWADDFYQRVYQNFMDLCWKTHRFYNQNSVYYMPGQAVAYICNYDKWDGSICQTAELDEFVRWGTGNCPGGNNGWKQAAYIYFRGQWLNSYGFTHSSNTFCGKGP